MIVQDCTQPDASKLRPEGTIWLLESVKWAYFSTILLPHRSMNDRGAEKIWNGFRGRLAKTLGIQPSKLLWAVAFERGRSGDNPHLHVLISGRFWKITTSERFISIMDQIGCAMELPGVKTQVFDRRRNAAAYICKELSQPIPIQILQSDRWPMISDGVVAALRRHPNRR